LTNPVSSHRQSCQHCGSPFAPRGGEAFCCPGCASVHQLIVDTGLEDYYQHKSGISAPVLEAPFTKLDWSWLEERTRSENEAVFGISGIACEGCSWLARRIVEQHEGVDVGPIDAKGGRITLTWSQGADLASLAQELQRYSFIIESQSPIDAPTKPSRFPLAFCIVFGVNAALLRATLLFQPEKFAAERLFDLLSLLLGALSLITFGHYLGSWRHYRAQKARLQTGR